jgi:hypothetical protein
MYDRSKIVFCLNYMNQKLHNMNRKCFTCKHVDWLELQQVAYAMGYRSRNALIMATLKQVLADHQQAKTAI